MSIDIMIMKAIRASYDAGKAILEVYHTDFEVEKKSDDSPLTRADMNAHAVISNALEDTGLPVLSEEGKDIAYETRKEWKQFWMVDPLDGTKEFVNRNGEFTVNIALIENGFPHAGVIYIPVADELYFGLEGRGAYRLAGLQKNLKGSLCLDELMAKSLRLPSEKAPDQFTVVCSRSHMSPETEAYIEELKHRHGELDYVSRGSSLKLCMVADGTADIYPRFAPTMEWDTAAGQAIAESSGASVIRSLTGERLSYNKPDLLNPWFIVKR